MTLVSLINVATLAASAVTTVTAYVVVRRQKADRKEGEQQP